MSLLMLVLEKKKWIVSYSVMSNSLWPMDCSLPGFSAHGISQARILEWVAITSSRGSSQPRDWTCVSCLLLRQAHSTTSATWEVPGLDRMTGDWTGWQAAMRAWDQDRWFKMPPFDGIEREGWGGGGRRAWWPGQCVLALSVLTWCLALSLGFPDGLAGKEPACNAGDWGSIPGLGRSPGGGHGDLLQYSCLENSCGQGSLAGYSPRGCKETDTTEWLSTAQHNTEPRK